METLLSGSNMEKAYLDNSATTQVDKEVIQIMTEFMQNDYGNPNSLHQLGRKAREKIENARKKIADFLNVLPEEIIFTSGGTESDNIAILGTARASNKKHIITSNIEHPAVTNVCEELKLQGYKIDYVPVDKEGIVNPGSIKKAITPDTLLVSIMHVNNEIGTIQPIEKIAEICHEKGVLFHTDAVQSFGKIPIDVKETNIDFVSMSAHKIYGPKGVGALYIKSPDKLSPVFIGGGQERNIRPGTENLAGIAGFGTAAKLIKEEILLNAERLRKLQFELMKRFSKLTNVIISGPNLDKVKENVPHEKFLYRLPGHVSICCKDVEGESLVLQADLKGIAISSGSACSSRSTIDRVSKIKPSHVLQACKTPKDYIKGSLRVTFGKDNSENEALYIFETVKSIIESVKRKVAC